MSKKHFIRLADYIKNAEKHCDVFTPSQIGLLAIFCAEQNRHFNRSRWLGYIAGECGPNGGSVKGRAA